LSGFASACSEDCSTIDLKRSAAVAAPFTRQIVAVKWRPAVRRDAEAVVHGRGSMQLAWSMVRWQLHRE
jgi:hypothetical protein